MRRTQKLLGFLGNSAGITIIEQLVGLIVILIAFAAWFGVFDFLAATNRKSATLTLMIRTEGLIFSAFSDRDFFNNLAPNIRAGVIPTGALVTYQGSTLGRIDNTATVNLNQAGAVCADPTQPDCLIGVALDIRCDAAGAGRACTFAYQIRPHHVNVRDFGVKSGGASFALADYIFPISFAFTEQGLGSNCDPAVHSFVTGILKFSGAPICMTKPTVSCGAGQVATGVELAGLDTLRYICADLNTILCPQYYALSFLRASSIAPGAAKVGTCTLLTQNSVPWQTVPPPASTVSGTFCPENYIARASCSLLNPVGTPASCTYSCNCVTNPNPPYDTQCGTCTCSVNPIPGSVILNHGTNRTAACSVYVPNQPSCAECTATATWTASASMTGTCEADGSVLPETKPIL